jgi:hypothetical protein
VPLFAGALGIAFFRKQLVRFIASRNSCVSHVNAHIVAVEFAVVARAAAKDLQSTVRKLKHRLMEPSSGVHLPPKTMHSLYCILHGGLMMWQGSFRPPTVVLVQA